MNFAHHDYIVHLLVRGAGVLAHMSPGMPTVFIIEQQYEEIQLIHLKNMGMCLNFISPELYRF